MIDNLCCYKEIEQDHSSPLKMHYLSMRRTVEELGEIKSELRGATIGSLVDENDKSEIYKILKKYNFDSIEEYQREVETGGEDVGIMAPSGFIQGSLNVRVQTLYPRKFNSIEDVEDELIEVIKVESKKSSIVLGNGVTSLLTISSKDVDESSGRKLLSRIIGISNLIATSTRIGPANTILINPKLKLVYNNILSQIPGFQIISSNKVEGNRIYIFRNSNDPHHGPICVTYNKTLDEYYIGITYLIKNSCFTFEII